MCYGMLVFVQNNIPEGLIWKSLVDAFLSESSAGGIELSSDHAATVLCFLFDISDVIGPRLSKIKIWNQYQISAV